MSSRGSAGARRRRWPVVVAAVGALILAAPSVRAQCFSASNPIPEPVPWTAFGTSPGFTLDYTYQGLVITDNQTSSDPSNGGAAVSPSQIDIASGGNPGAQASAFFGYYDGGSAWDPADPSTMSDDFIFFRIRVAADPTKKDGFDSYHWNILFDLDSDGYKEYWLDLEGSYTSASGPDRLRVLFNNDNTQLVNDPDAASVVDLDAYNDGRSGSYTYAHQTDDDPTQWYIDIQVPMVALKDLNCNQQLYPDSPVAFFYSTGASNTDPLQKDHMMDGDFITAADPITFGDIVYPNGQPSVTFIDDAFTHVTTYQIADGPVEVWVNDRLANLDPSLRETVVVTVTDPATGDNEQLTLTETGPDSGIFTSMATVSPSQSLPTATFSDPPGQDDGTLEVNDGDVITVSYINASGTTVSDTAVMIGHCGAHIEFTRADGRPSSSFQLTSSSATSDRLYVTVYYPDANTYGNGSPTVVDTLTVQLSGWDVQTLTLTETGPDTGVFRNPTGLPTKVSDGTVTANDGLWEDVDGGVVEAHLDYTCDGTHRTASAEASLFYIPNAARVYFVDSTGRYDVDLYTSGQPIYVQVTDADAEACAGVDACSGSPRTVTATLSSPVTGDSVEVTLTETNPVGGVCSTTFLSDGSVHIRTASGSGLPDTTDSYLDAADGETILVSYHDCNDGDSDSANDVKSDTAVYNAPHVVIDEVLFQPGDPSCVGQYVTLLNNGADDRTLTGYSITDGDNGWSYTIPDWDDSVSPAEPLVLEPGDRVVISFFASSPLPYPDRLLDYWTDSPHTIYYLNVHDSSADELGDTYTQGSSTFTYDQAYLLDPSGNPVDYVSWSNTASPGLDFLGDDRAAVEAGIWPDNAFVNLTTVADGSAWAPGDVLVRVTPGHDTNLPRDWTAIASDLCSRLELVTPVVVSGMSATLVGDDVVVGWATTSEVGTVGFDLYRVLPGGRQAQRVNHELLPAAVGTPQGARYRFVDAGAPHSGTISYMLIERTTTARTRTYGPFEVVVAPAAPDQTAPSGGYQFTPLGASAGHQRRVAAHRREAAQSAAARAREAETLPVEAENGGELAVASGVWTRSRFSRRLKIEIDTTGLYLLTAESIAEGLGLPPRLVTKRLRVGQLDLTAGGRQVAWHPLSDGSGMVFFGQAPDSQWATRNVYWLTIGRGRTMATASGGEPVPQETPTVFEETLHLEEDHVAVVLNETDPLGDFWFWGYVLPGHPSMGSLQLHVDAPELSTGGGMASATVHLKGWSGVPAFPDHHARLGVNGQTVGEVYFDGTEHADLTATFPQSLLHETGNLFEVAGVADPGVTPLYFMIDSVDLSYRRTLTAQSDRCRGRLQGGATVSVAGFSSPDVTAFDVSAPQRPVLITGLTIDGQAGGYRASFRPPSTSSDVELTTRAALLSPARIVVDRTSDLHSALHRADWIAIAPTELLAAAGRLAAVHESQGLSTEVVSLEDVYDEFSAGLASPLALRDFIAFAATRWSKAPRYVVLVGSGTYDYRDVLGMGDNLLPVLMATTPDGIYASDSLLGDVDGDGVPDLAVGRVPVLTNEELDRYTARVARHAVSAGGGGWRSRMVMAAGDPEHTLADFSADSSQLISILSPALQVDRVDEVAEGFSAARQHLFDELASGALLVNYIGHGGADRLATRGLLTTGDVANLHNTDRLPVLTALTCAVGLFQIPGYTSLAEQLVLGQDGGALAVWAPTALSVNSEARVLGEGFFRSASSGRGTVRLGDAVTQAFRFYAQKGHLGYLPAIYNLFGDPAVELQ